MPVNGQLPQTTPEQRSPLYEDVETLLEYGFLSYSMTIAGVSISIRSLNPGDRFILKHRVHGIEGADWRSVAISSSMWMIDGYNLLGEPNVAPIINKTIRSLPDNARAILFNAVTSLLDRVSKAVDAVESYAYEKSSRYKWRTMGGQSFSSHTGVHGDRSMGTNHVQRMWTFYNIIEDTRVADDNMWEGFKLTASAQAPKGVKKIDARDKQQRQMEQDRRQNVQDQFYYVCKGVIKPREHGGTKTNGGIHGPKTADDLVEEMQRWVSGDEDWHDQIVTEYKQQIADAYEKHKAEAAARVAAFEAMREEESDTPQVMVGYTAEQLNEILKDRNYGPPGVRNMGSDFGTTRDNIYTRYMGNTPDSGALRVANGKVVIASDEAPAAESLNDQIANRNVNFHPVEEDTELETDTPLPGEW